MKEKKKKNRYINKLYILWLEKGIFSVFLCRVKTK